MVPDRAHSFSREPGLEIWSVWRKGAMLKRFKEVETIPLPWYKQKGGTKICFQFGTWGLDLESQIECYKGPPDCTSHYQKPESVLFGWNHGNHDCKTHTGAKNRFSHLKPVSLLGVEADCISFTHQACLYVCVQFWSQPTIWHVPGGQSCNADIGR